MPRSGRTFFQIEDLQPDWVNRSVYAGAVAAVYTLLRVGIGGLIGLVGWALGGGGAVLVALLILGARFGLIGGVAIGLLWAWEPIVPQERLFWSWRAVRKAAPREVPILIIWGVMSAAIVGLLLEGPGGVVPFLASGAILGLIGILPWSGLTSRVPPRRSRPGEGIATTLRNGLRFGGVGVPLMIAILWLTALVLPDDVVFGAWTGWSLLGATVAGFAGGFWFIGGYVALQHISLRLALALQRRLPLRLIAFLDHATRLILLRRAGGGWVFIPRRLQEHLAAGAPDAT